MNSANFDISLPSASLEITGCTWNTYRLWWPSRYRQIPNDFFLVWLRHSDGAALRRTMLMAFVIVFAIGFGTLKSGISYFHHPNWPIFGCNLGTLISVWKCNNDEISHRMTPLGKRLSALELIIKWMKSNEKKASSLKIVSPHLNSKFVADSAVFESIVKFLQHGF